MAKNPRVQPTLAEAHDVQSVWQTIPDFKMGDVSLNDFAAAISAADAFAKQHANNAVNRTGLKANRDDRVRQLSELVTRFRSVIRGTYGPDSPVYEQTGGTRSSSRRSPKRQAGAAPATSTPAAPATAAATDAPAAQHA